MAFTAPRMCLNPTASRTACSCSTASSCDEGPFGIKVSIVRAGLSRTIQSKVQQDAITRQHKAALLATGMLIHCLYWYLAGAQQEAPVSCWHSLQAHAGHSDAHLPCRDLECNSSYLCSSPTHMPSPLLYEPAIEVNNEWRHAVRRNFRVYQAREGKATNCMYLGHLRCFVEI